MKIQLYYSFLTESIYAGNPWYLFSITPKETWDWDKLTQTKIIIMDKNTKHSRRCEKWFGL